MQLARDIKGNTKTFYKYGRSKRSKARSLAECGDVVGRLIMDKAEKAEEFNAIFTSGDKYSWQQG